MSTVTTDAAVDAVAARDSRIPGLAILLSPGRLSETLGIAVRPRRVRYKPGASVVVAFEAGGESRWVAAHTDPAKARKAVRRAARANPGAATVPGVPGTAATVTMVPGTVTMVPGLPGTVTGPALADRHLAGTVRQLIAVEPGLVAQARVLRHNPHRRLVLRSGDRVLKVAFAASTLPAGVADAGLPVLVPEQITQGVTATPWWGRGDLGTAWSSAAANAAGAALARLHSLGPRGAPPAEPGAELAAALRALDAVAPASAVRARAIARRLRVEADGPALLHGDFTADQVLVDEDEVRLIDFDRARSGVPERDLGSFAADARLNGRGHPGELVAAYRATGARVDEHALRHWIVFAFLLRAAEPFRQVRADWPEAIEAAVAAAAEALG